MSQQDWITRIHDSENRGVISRFPFSSALVAGILFFGFLLLTIGLCLLPMVVSDSHRRIFGRPPALPVPQDNYPNSDTGVQPARRIKRPRTNRGEQLAEVYDYCRLIFGSI